MGQDLLPDDLVLSQIFPEAKPASIDILANNWDICTFKAHFDTKTPPELPLDLVVRMETSTGHLEAVTAFQNLARTQIPKLVPHIFSSGKASTANGLNVEYTVTEFIADALTLESIWPSLPRPQQRTLMDAIVEALAKLQQPHVRDNAAALIASLPQQVDKIIGGPHHGYHNDMQGLLTHFVAKHQTKNKATSSITPTQDGLVIASTQPDLPAIHLTRADLAALNSSAVLCHNDLEPRNVLVRHHPGSNTYLLAAIIDWEFSAIAPFAFESALKDTALGAANLHYDWYRLYKHKTRRFIPDGEAARKLVGAVRMVVEAQRRGWTRNVGAEFRRRWMSREGVEMGENGWVKGQGGGEWVYEKRRDEELEMEILREWGSRSEDLGRAAWGCYVL
tara:strand:- start:23885 stop:25060 length:1176 start_codon:yes stop_codon:yes gene_type:complete